MSAIKKFFEKKKLDVKFKQAGHGHKLNESRVAINPCPTKTSSTARMRLPSESSAKAAEAAMARQESTQKQNKRPTSATTTWKTSSGLHPLDMQQLKSSINQERNNDRSSTSEGSGASIEYVGQVESTSDTSCIVFSCPVCPVCLPENEIQSHIKQCLYREIDSEPGMIAASIIHTCNPIEKTRIGVDILNKYFDNILTYPNEEKYRKIKQSNKIFKEKVAPLEGVKELLTLAAGFVDVKMPVAEGEEESFYVLSEGLALENERLEILKSYLNEAGRLEASLDRNIKVLEPATASFQLNIPDEFYCLSQDELKKEHRERISVVEKNKQLRTKAMRDAENSNLKKLYRFTLIRVRFPDGIILEGTFYSKDKLLDVQKFVKDSLEFDWLPFDLFDASGRRLTEHDRSLELLDLSPAAILNFRWNPSADLDIQPYDNCQYLTDELLTQKTTLS